MPPAPPDPLAPPAPPPPPELVVVVVVVVAMPPQFSATPPQSVHEQPSKYSTHWPLLKQLSVQRAVFVHSAQVQSSSAVHSGGSPSSAGRQPPG
jgi:hypothetical protein